MSSKNFGELLVYYRSLSAMSQDELSKMSGVSKNQIARYETNKAAPRLRSIMKLAKALDISINDLGYRYISAMEIL